jgi:hypothetical protein
MKRIMTRKRALIAAIGISAALGIAILNIAGVFADKAGELRTGDRGSHFLTDRVEVIQIISDDRVLVKTLPNVFADGTTAGSIERDEYSLATGDEAIAVFPSVDDSAIERIKNLKKGDIIEISRWGDTKIDYSSDPWTIGCEKIR